MNVGYHDALVQMDIQRMKDGVMKLAKRNGHGDIQNGVQNHEIRELEESLYQIQNSVKIENGYNTIKQVENFMNKVEDIGEVDEGGLLLREEKGLLIAAAKQLQDTINNNSTTKKIDSKI